MQANWEQFAIEAQYAASILGAIAEFGATVGDTSIPDEVIDYTGSNKIVQT